MYKKSPNENGVGAHLSSIPYEQKWIKKSPNKSKEYRISPNDLYIQNLTIKD